MKSLEVSNSIGTGPVEGSLEWRKAMFGCVVRAVESITGVVATEEEWAMRLNEAESSPFTPEEEEDILGPVPTIESLTQLIFLGAKKDIERVGAYLHKISKGSTQMGRALQQMTHVQTDLTLPGIQGMIENGDQVMIADFNSNMMLHASHVGLSEDGGFVTLSDGGKPMRLQEYRSYNVFIFRKRPEL